MMFSQRAAHPLSHSRLIFSGHEPFSLSWSRNASSSISWTEGNQFSISWRHRSGFYTRDQTIARVLETEEGRAALAAAMVEPIRRRLRETGFARQILSHIPSSSN